jgi:hypothetical protein
MYPPGWKNSQISVTFHCQVKEECKNNDYENSAEAFKKFSRRENSAEAFLIGFDDPETGKKARQSFNSEKNLTRPS